MRRDFEAEYKKYIEADVPDLWARIEPDLKEKRTDAAVLQGAEKSKGKGYNKWFNILKYAAAAAACLCVLIVSVIVLRQNGMIKNAADAVGDKELNAAAEGFNENEAEADYEEEMAWEAEDSYKDEMTGEAENSYEGKMTESAAAVESVQIERAVLSKISVTGKEKKAEGYAYAYTFVLEDESKIIVFATAEQCAEMEESGILLKRQAAYALTVSPCKTGVDSGESAGEYFLEKIEKLP